MDYNVKLEYDTIQSIITNELKYDYATLKRDYESREEGSMAIWDHNVKKDKKLIKKHMKALKHILKYYGVDAE